MLLNIKIYRRLDYPNECGLNSFGQCVRASPFSTAIFRLTATSSGTRTRGNMHTVAANLLTRKNAISLYKWREGVIRNVAKPLKRKSDGFFFNKKRKKNYVLIAYLTKLSFCWTSSSLLGLPTLPPCTSLESQRMRSPALHSTNSTLSVNSSVRTWYRSLWLKCQYLKFRVFFIKDMLHFS